MTANGNRFSTFAVMRWRMAMEGRDEWGAVRTDMHTCASILPLAAHDDDDYDMTYASMLAEIAHMRAMENTK